MPKIASCAIPLLLCALRGWSQTPADALADAMLARIRGAAWERAYTAPARASGVSCSQRVPAQMDVYATTEWTHHCVETRDGIIRESFYYVFGEPARTALLRVDVRPQDESPEFSAAVLRALEARLSRRLGQPDHAPELMEIGFRHLRYGQPVSGDHWKTAAAHYFLHANLSASAPMGVRHGAQLVVLHSRLFEERLRDDLILQVEGFGGQAQPGGSKQAQLTTRQLDQNLTTLLQEADRSDRAGKASRLLKADAKVMLLSARLTDPAPGGEHESADAGPVRRKLARYGVKLGHMTHYGGLEYRNDLLWRVWREFPDTEAGERAFLQLQNRGWNTDSGEGCPPNPDLFRTVIEKGEAFLTERPQSPIRLQVLYTVAVAYESWWSIAHAPADDGIVSAPPYPRRTANAGQDERARLQAIEDYRQVAQMAPASPEGASALRRLPRLELRLDTGQRRFFCFYC